MTNEMGFNEAVDMLVNTVQPDWTETKFDEFSEEALKVVLDYVYNNCFRVPKNKRYKEVGEKSEFTRDGHKLILDHGDPDFVIYANAPDDWTTLPDKGAWIHNRDIYAIHAVEHGKAILARFLVELLEELFPGRRFEDDDAVTFTRSKQGFNAEAVVHGIKYNGSGISMEGAREELAAVLTDEIKRLMKMRTNIKSFAK